MERDHYKQKCNLALHGIVPLVSYHPPCRGPARWIICSYWNIVAERDDESRLHACLWQMEAAGAERGGLFVIKWDPCIQAGWLSP